MDFITIPLVLLIIFGTFYKIIKLYAMRRERILYIEKMADFPPTGAPMLPYPTPYNRSADNASGLRWGLLAIGVGLGIFVAIVTALCLNTKVATHPWMIVDDYSIVLAAFMFIFGGLGLVLSYIIEIRRHNRANK